MPRTLFEDVGVSGRGRGGSLRALPFSLGVHALAVAAVAFLAVRPAASELSETPMGTLFLPRDPRPAPAEQHALRAAPAPSHANRAAHGGAPAPIPLRDPEGVQPEALADREPPSCLTNCGDDTGASDDAQRDGGAQPGDAEADGQGIGPRQVGGDIRPPVKIHDVLPVYPELARRAGVQGMVVIQCLIDETGRVVDARVLKGPLLLDEAALDAVRQWTYRPTQLNDKPVAVIMTVTVNFVRR